LELGALSDFVLLADLRSPVNSLLVTILCAQVLHEIRVRKQRVQELLFLGFFVFEHL
jgi:hypothetical protein